MLACFANKYTDACEANAINYSAFNAKPAGAGLISNYE